MTTTSTPARAVDVLGRPYRAESIELAADDEGEVVATLVHRPSRGPRGKAVLHVHGFADYFFQTPAADSFGTGLISPLVLERRVGRTVELRHQPVEILGVAYQDFGQKGRRA